jgi:hypothetical protein
MALGLLAFIFATNRSRSARFTEWQSTTTSKSPSENRRMAAEVFMYDSTE